jgi:CBS domain-containing protein
MNVGALAHAPIVSVDPGRSVREAASVMREAEIGSALVLRGQELAGIITERDVLRAVAEGIDVNREPVSSYMTADVISVEPDWEVDEAAAEMAAHHIRHLVVSTGERIFGVVSIRDLLLAGHRVELTAGNWAILRDPRTFPIRERRRLQRRLLEARRGDGALDALIGLFIARWSFDLELPAGEDSLSALPDEDRARLRAAVKAELPGLQRSVHPAPGWRQPTRVAAGRGRGPS